MWVETPSNPLWKITDIAAIGAIARAAGARYVCDNTTATPVLQSPLTLGADLVVHATTKYLGGHGDVLGGAVVSRVADELFERIRGVQASAGAVHSPFDCWLVRRGIRTLPYRVRGHCENALRVATFLHGHRRVEAVHGLREADVARRQMTAFGGGVGQIHGDRARDGRRGQASGLHPRHERARRLRFAPRVHRGCRSRAAVLLRLSIGLEHHDDLIEISSGRAGSRADGRGGTDEPEWTVA